MTTKSWILSLILVAANIPASAQHYKVLHSFSGTPNDASYVISSLVFDSKGNLYGTSANGGNGYGPEGQGNGTVFELSPNGDGTWSESVIYNFCSDFNGVLCLDGAASRGSLVFDAHGNLYGTTFVGGSGNNCPYLGPYGCGTVFELSPAGDAWSETVLYNLCSVVKNGICQDGFAPEAPLVFGSDGALYSTAAGGSGHYPGVGGGMIFKLAPGKNGWIETTIYSFCSKGQNTICPDGDGPNTDGVSFGLSGKLYGVTGYGGSTQNVGTGVVYELSPNGNNWDETVLAAFPSPGNQDAGQPTGGVAVDAAGNLYGTFEFPYGGVFRLNPKTLERNVFLFDGADGDQPIGGVTLDMKHGVLYGTASGFAQGVGGIYKIDSSGKETVLYQFCSQPNCTDGDLPWATMIMDKDGNLYGTTEFGGEYNNGVVFEYTP